MASKRKEIHLRHKAYFEQKLKDRLKSLSGKGVEPAAAEKDPIVRNLQAEIRTANRRLRAIASQEKLAEELAKRKAAKAAARKEEEGGKPEKAEKPKKAGAEAKEKKPKAEKKSAPPKPAEAGATGQPAAESHEESKAPAKK